ncbi:MAG: ATP-binding protein [Planctomycetota bacterium]|nr:ATP-binding protein [Planctomycetota bacterium]MDG2143203.1 ATP-binding protein [Planctomycetota bacterium]
MSQLADTTVATEQRSEKIESAMRSFSEISSNLLKSYSKLEARAERVEHKLAVANRTLESKVLELDEVTRNLEAILAALPTGVVVRDADGAIVRINDAAAVALGLSTQQKDRAIGSPDVEVLKTARAAKGAVVLANGSARVLDLRSSMVRNDQGRSTGTVEIIDDRTEITALGERLHAMDKVASLGTMAGGIAHELRNPLNAVAGFADLMQSRLKTTGTEDPKIIRWAQLIGRGAAEANAIITSLLTLSTPEGLDRSGIGAEDLLKEAVQAAVTPEQTQPDVEFITDVESFTGDRIKLRQALRNLVANAMDVAPGSPLRIKATQTDEGELALEVHDAGPGIAAEMRRRVLDPFFTTRAEGTGLGLALASTIAGLHGGHLEIQNSPSDLGGALVAIHLPLLTARS